MTTETPKPKRPSRKGVPIKPHKGGRTLRFPEVRMTKDELNMLNEVLKRKALTVTEWVMQRIKEDYENLEKS